MQPTRKGKKLVGQSDSTMLSLTRSDDVFLSGVNSSNFARNLFERPEFEETSNVEFENNAAEEETPAAVEDVVMCKKRLNFMKFEEDILLRIQKDLRTRARNWSGTHLEQYHDAVADFCRKELDKADIGTMLVFFIYAQGSDFIRVIPYSRSVLFKSSFQRLAGCLRP